MKVQLIGGCTSQEGRALREVWQKKETKKKEEGEERKQNIPQKVGNGLRKGVAISEAASDTMTLDLKNLDKILVDFFQHSCPSSLYG